eukprot:TRINITY_DN11181_c0_g1_i1.p1 TRINITY_DN11181_c0_g1~~TRINITY_DN11181_c0_g1_i1.p1  ORF type:complete len:462 (-),score=75.87 TRINITY_DN11181_c0_g1_i1:25-1332(-)
MTLYYQRGYFSSLSYTSLVYPSEMTCGQAPVTDMFPVTVKVLGADYQNNQACQWLVRSANTAARLSLVFNTFDTEASADFVRIYDGETTSAPLLGEFSGSTLPAAIASGKNALLISWTSNAAGVSPGWSATVNRVMYSCGQAPPADSFPITIMGPTPDSRATTCQWLLRSAFSNARLRITLEKIGRFAGVNSQSGDTLVVYDGGSASYPELARFSDSGSQRLPAAYTTTSTGQSLFMKWDLSYRQKNFNVWMATIERVAFTCGEAPPTDLTPITLSVRDYDYQNNQDCQWLLRSADAAARIVLAFDRFNTEESADFVRVYDGNTTSSPLLGQFSGNYAPAPMMSSSHVMLVTWKTNGATVKPGWIATATRFASSAGGGGSGSASAPLSGAAETGIGLGVGLAVGIALAIYEVTRYVRRRRAAKVVPAAAALNIVA